MNGMFGQYVAIFPRQQAVAVMLSGNGNLFADSVAYTCLREGGGPAAVPPTGRCRRAAGRGRRWSGCWARSSSAAPRRSGSGGPGGWQGGSPRC